MKKVITYGTFDLFHKGHYRLLERAKALGDYLVVGVTTEEYDQTRGKLNVVDSLLTRIENVKKTGFADEIIIEATAGQKERDIQKYNIDIFTVGSDWIGKFDYLKKYCEVVYLERTKGISSTILRTKNKHILKFGVIGAGRIANRFMPEANLVSGISVQGIYTHRKESTDNFAKHFNIDSYYDLDSFFKDIDAVYIASPHDTHYDYIKTSLEHNKHVICEKPMVLTKKQAKEVFQLAEDNGLVLFEGIKTAYCPAFNKLLEVIESGTIGTVYNIEACFTKLENPNSRELTDLKYGGSFIELASYCMLPIVKILGNNYKNITFNSIKAENGLDIFTKAFFIFDNGFGTATCGLGVKSEGEMIISGTKGYIVVKAPWWKTTEFEVRRENPNDITKYSDRFLGDGLRYELSDFLKTIKGKENIKSKLTKEQSIFMAEVMEKFLKEK